MNWIDPPLGWRYGFPKILPDGLNTKTTLRQWLIDQGYPEKDVNFAMDHCRYWSTENVEKTPD